MYRRFGKRVLDLCLAVSVLVLAVPVMVVAGFLVKVDSSGPVFFVQDRLGREGKVFALWKFRSMTDQPREVAGEIHGEHPDLTRIGRVLRRLKCDELPQLLHVLRGEMSLVGPRPCHLALEQDFTDEARRRLAVRPGITGLAQVSGNTYLSWEERWRLDALYVEHHDLLMDLGILIKTVGVVLLGEERFKGR